MRRRFTRVLALVAVVLTFLVMAASPASASYVTVWEHGYAGFYQATNANSYEGVEMTFTVPSNADQHCAPSTGLPTWVGMYGTNSIYPFIQNGVTINDNGTTSGWYEIFDKNGATVTTGVPGFTADPGDSITLREVWGYGHENVWFVWSNHSTGQYYVIKRYLPGYYPNGSMVPQYIAEDNYSATHWEGHYWRIPWFGQMNVTHAWAEQTSSSTPVDGAGVPYREGVVPLDDSNATEQLDMWNYDQQLTRIDESVPQNGAFNFNQHYCY